jgi:hypothetical protein
MNTLILNRDTFQMPEDGWYQIAPLGEFPHGAAGVVQIVDKAACDAMANAFRTDAGVPNFAGLLIDFDHFSLDDKSKSEAAGWITALENRDTGLYATIRWSDVGEECVKGGRYRFLSPVWSRADCEDLGNGRVRPVRLLNAAVTNDPNLKGMVPLSNRGQVPGDRSQEDSPQDLLENADGQDRFKWTLGTSPEDRHCPSCVALAGQVHSMTDWDAAGLAPGAGCLYCQGSCHCSLVKTDAAAAGDLSDAPQRKPDPPPPLGGSAETSTEDGKVISNKGWTDEARAASLAVRRAKAAARKAARERAYVLDRTRGAAETYRSRAEEAYMQEHGRMPTSPEEIAAGEELADVPEAFRTGGKMTPEELAERIVGDSDEGPAAPEASEIPERDAEVEGADPLAEFEENGLSELGPDAVQALTDRVREKLVNGEPLEPAEERFISARADDGYAGDGDSDPVYEWVERQAMSETEREQLETADAAESAHERAEGLMAREEAGEDLTQLEQAFLEQYREIVGNRLRPRANTPGTAPGQDRHGSLLANAGWGDEARSASLAVRRARSAARAAGKRIDPDSGDHHTMKDRPREDSDMRRRPPVPLDDDGMIWAGGTPYFDERTGEYVYPHAPPPGTYPAMPEDPRIQPMPYELPRFADQRQIYRGEAMPWSPEYRVAEDKMQRRMALQRNR